MSRRPVAMLIVVAAVIGGVCVWLAVSGAGPAMPSSTTGQPGSTATTIPGQGGAQTGSAGAAIQSAADAGKYVFVYFYDGKDVTTRESEKRFGAAARKFADRSRSVVVDVADQSVQALVTKLGADRAPMPFIIAMAPNGAVTAGLRADFTDEQMAGSFVSPGTERCLAGLQQGRLVVVCVQGTSTKLNAAIESRCYIRVASCSVKHRPN